MCFPTKSGKFVIFFIFFFVYFRDIMKLKFHSVFGLLTYLRWDCLKFNSFPNYLGKEGRAKIGFS